MQNVVYPSASQQCAVELSGRVVERSQVYIPVAPGGEGYFGSDEWRAVYPAVLRAYYGALGFGCGQWFDRWYGSGKVSGSGKGVCFGGLRCPLPGGDRGGSGNNVVDGSSEGFACRCVDGDGVVPQGCGVVEQGDEGVPAVEGVVDADGESREERREFDLGAGRSRGKHWRKNLKKREAAAEKKKNAGVVPEWRQKKEVVAVGKSKTELQASLEAKWKVENELKVLEAQRKIELLKKQDVDAIAKCNARKLQAASEKAMVQMEKAHATLVATGNVPGEVALGGTAHTVVDGEIVPSLTNSCSISPSSSISEREVREMMKALEDEKKKNAELEEKMKFMKLDHKLERFGDQCAVTMTCDSEGELPEGREELLEQIVRANNGREEDRVYKKDFFKKKIVNVKVQQYRQLGMDEYVGAFDY